ncbi:DUF2508 family protein [Paenibacillus sp. HB172176]|uniref:DUF2508 family protein n=1 Tax=Paenibacillus sp. HB172176 TaxID=2493690 RepID=UPI00143B3927|nr:DUF2508 family protein [Paenibacillus sp. HB172176]
MVLLEQRGISAADDLQAKESLMSEIRDALLQRESARRYFDCVKEFDQIDYAIYAIIAAEKRYAMLLGKAKKMVGEWPEWRRMEL